MYFWHVFRDTKIGSEILIFNLYTYHPDTVYLHEQGYEDPWLFFEAKRCPREKSLGNTAVDCWVGS